MLDAWLEAWQLRELVLKNKVRPREAAEFFLGRIERLNPRFGAFMTVTAERAFEDAARLERVAPAERATMPLYGVPFSLKDLTWTKGIRTTLGSKNFENFVPAVDQEYAARIMRAGGILLGKTTTPEFGGKPTTDGGLCPTACNPWQPAHTAGGSSGGAAAAVAAGMNPIAEGSDGGGSIRIPASCCGIVGIKPSRGRVTFAPVMGEAWAGFATNGPLAHSVRDAALLLDVMSGPHDGDPYWAPAPRCSFVDAATKLRPGKLRLAMIAETSLARVEPETLAAFESACGTLRKMGHSIEPLKLDPADLLKPIAQKLICAGVGSIPLKDPDAVDPAVRVLWETGRRTSAADYIATVSRMHNIAREIVQHLTPYDGLLTPTLPRPAVKHGELYPSPDQALEATFSWVAYTFPFNSTGQPAISLPNGFTSTGLPIGLQIVGRPADEVGLIALAAAFEEARPWRDKHPPVD
ncbi:MAG TPA: amidase [Candidatus Binataceae bacterium]|nr:amidase [Candidatus Binataceae bacterium]